MLCQLTDNPRNWVACDNEATFSGHIFGVDPRVLPKIHSCRDHIGVFGWASVGWSAMNNMLQGTAQRPDKKAFTAKIERDFDAFMKGKG